MEMKIESRLLLYTRNIPHPQRHTLPYSKDLRKGFPIKHTKKHAGLSILICNKIDFKQKSFRRDGEKYFIIITGTIHQDEI